MTLYYKFKKEKLDNGQFVQRPRILVRLSGEKAQIEVPALIDSGADITVVPEGMARALGVPVEGTKSTLYGFRESTEVIQSKVAVTFIGKANRESVKSMVPILITLSREGHQEEQDIVLGVEGVFDEFDITFKKSKNQIILKKVLRTY